MLWGDTSDVEMLLVLLGGVEMLWVFVEFQWGDYVENFEKWLLTD